MILWIGKPNQAKGISVHVKGIVEVDDKKKSNYSSLNRMDELEYAKVN